MVSSSWWYYHGLYPYDESWWSGRSAVVHCVHGENLGIPKMRGANFLDAQSRTSRNAQSLFARLFVCLLCAYSFALWISVVGLFACCLFVCLFVCCSLCVVCLYLFVRLFDWLIDFILQFASANDWLLTLSFLFCYSFVVCCWLFVVRCLLFVVCSLLFDCLTDWLIDWCILTHSSNRSSLNV